MNHESSGKYEYDIFISYAHRDASPYLEGLREDLQALISQLLARDIKIWQDHLMNEDDDPEIVIPSALQQSATLVLLVTPISVTRKWVAKEYQLFKRGVLKMEGLEKRIFPFLVGPIENAHFHNDLMELQDIQIDHDPFLRLMKLRSAQPEYQRQLEQLAREICNVLNQIK